MFVYILNIVLKRYHSSIHSICCCHQLEKLDQFLAGGHSFKVVGKILNIKG